jgi:hypothetical protein
MALIKAEGRLVAAEHVKRMVQPIERAVVLPATEEVVHRATRWQVLRDRAPLATGAQHIHQAVHPLTHVHRPLVTASPGTRDLGLCQVPFRIGQVAGIAQLAAVIPGSRQSTLGDSCQKRQSPGNHNLRQPSEPGRQAPAVITPSDLRSLLSRQFAIDTLLATKSIVLR